MTAKDLFSQTMPFVWAKLLLGGALVLISAVLLALMLSLGWLFGDGGMLLMFVLWLSVVGGVRFVLMHYVGYLVKAGHVAVVAEAFASGRIPDNQLVFGKSRVIERFAASNVFFAVDKLIAAAIKQIQNSVAKAGNALDFLPGIGALTGAVQFFIGIFLGYIDECCLGWTFYKKDQGAFRSAADGVVIYAQNWKTLMKDAAGTLLRLVLYTVLVALAVFVPVGLLFKLLGWNPFAAFLLAVLIAWVIKFAVLDSYIMIRMMASYMQVAPSTPVTADLYAGLCSISSSFRELFEKARTEPNPTCAPNGVSEPGFTAQPAGKTSIFCGRCGAHNSVGSKFCGTCGSDLQ